MTPTAVDHYSLCGPRSHYISMTGGTELIGTQKDAQRFKMAPFLEFQYYATGDPAAVVQPSYPPVYQIRINSTSMEDWGTHEMKLHFAFENYPLSTANSQTWTVVGQIEYCLPTSYQAPGNFEDYFTIGNKPKSINYIFQQFPCTYGANYTAKVVEISG